MKSDFSSHDDRPHLVILVLNISAKLNHQRCQILRPPCLNLPSFWCHKYNGFTEVCYCRCRRFWCLPCESKRQRIIVIDEGRMATVSVATESTFKVTMTLSVPNRSLCVPAAVMSPWCHYGSPVPGNPVCWHERSPSLQKQRLHSFDSRETRGFIWSVVSLQKGKSF